MNNKYLTASTVTLFDAEIHPPPLAEEKIVAVAIATISGRGRKRACFILPNYFDDTRMEMTA